MAGDSLHVVVHPSDGQGFRCARHEKVDPGAMHVEEFREYCLSLPGSNEKMPFQAFPAGRSILAFYVGGRIFCFLDIDRFDACTLKCDPGLIDSLKASYMAVGEPYNMSRKYWISIRFDDDMPDAEIKRRVLRSYELVSAKGCSAVP